MPKDKNEPVSLTEEQLRAETRKRRAEQAKLDALRKPSSPGMAKAENYWYHYKWHTVAGAVLLVMLAFFIRDLLFKVEPDATIVFISGQPVSTEAAETLRTALEERAGDRNGDGKVSILVDSIRLSASILAPESAEAQNAPGGEAEYASAMKMTAVIAANADLLYLVDDAVYQYLLNMASDGGPPASMFAALPVPGAEADRLPVSATVLADTPGLILPADLALCLRANEGAGEKDAAYYDYCMELLETIAVQGGKKP